MEINERSMPEDNNCNFFSHLERYKFCLKYVKNKKVISISCGSGYGEYILAVKGGAEEVIGIDYNSDAIEYAKNNYKNNNLFFYKRDALNNKLEDSSADIIISLETIEHIKEDKKLVQEFYRILRSGGRLIISTPNKAFSYKNLFSLKPINPYHIREYRKKSFLKLLSKYFQDIELYGQEVIFKRSIFTLLKYFYYKIRGKLKEIEKGGSEVVKYPGGNNLETCQFIAVCVKK